MWKYVAGISASVALSALGLAVTALLGSLGEFAENVPEDPRNLFFVTVAVTLGRR